MSGDTDQRPMSVGTAGRDEYILRDGIVDLSRPRGRIRSAQLESSPRSVVLDLNACAVIVVDMQNDFCSEGGLVSASGRDLGKTRSLFDPINRVVGAARNSEVPVIWLNWGLRPDLANLPAGVQYTFSDGRTPSALGAALPPTAARPVSHHVLVKGEWGAAIADGLHTDPRDIFVDKHRISGFWDTPLDSILRNLNVRTLFFCGVNLDQCVFATLMDGHFKGYDVVLLDDCVATTSPEFCRLATLHNVERCYGFTASSDGFLQSLQTP